ncbi:MAG: hypothetical protein ACOCWQ_02250, partial [Nanoarchaeota archaeon]
QAAEPVTENLLPSFMQPYSKLLEAASSVVIEFLRWIIIGVVIVVLVLCAVVAIIVRKEMQEAKQDADPNTEWNAMDDPDAYLTDYDREQLEEKKDFSLDLDEGDVGRIDR